MNAVPMDHLATTISNSNSWERMTIFLPLMRLLASGAPISLKQLARVLGRPEADVAEALRQFEEIVYDEDGRIVGAGLSLLPTPYRFEFQRQVLYTWCALDTLIFPIWLEHAAQISSACPMTGTSISLRISPEGVEQLAPPSGVMSLLIADGLATCCNIREAFCAYSQFFASRAAASTWQASHPEGYVLPVEEAFFLGQQLAKLTLQRRQNGKQ